MFSRLSAETAHIDELLAQGRPNDALANMVVAVHHHYKRPEVAHHALYYPDFDRQIQQMAALLDAQEALPTDPDDTAPRSNTLIVATELYQVGGHSRVVEDFARELGSPTIVLTDLFMSYRNSPNHLNWVHERHEGLPILPLLQTSLWAKCRALRQLTQRLRPSHIYYFHHHQDPIPFVATLGHAGARKVLVHHADHNPSLGITLPGMRHVDVTDEVAAVCSQHLDTPPLVLPLYVADAGVKTFSATGPSAGADAAPVSVVTSGTHVKFSRDGDLAFHLIAEAVLRAVPGRFFHIGPMEPDWLMQVRAHLEQKDIDPARFVPLGPVSSLWETLRGLDAHIYLGSAPVGGGRAAIEAQGCGYPLAYYRVADKSSLLAVESLYADPTLGWANLAELSQVLRALMPELPRHSAQSRQFYEHKFSLQEFRRVLANC